MDSFTLDNRGTDTVNTGLYKKVRIQAPQMDQFSRDVINQNLPDGYSVGIYETVANKAFEDFSYMINGIPKMLFTRSDHQSQRDTYHTSADSFDYYTKVAKQDKIIGDKVQVIGAALMTLDSQLVKPLNFQEYYTSLEASIKEEVGGKAATEALAAINETKKAADAFDKTIANYNKQYAKAVKDNDKKEISKLNEKAKGVNRSLYTHYKQFQDNFTKLNHSPGVVVAPHSAYQNNVEALRLAQQEIEKGNLDNAIVQLRKVDSNGLATDFSKQTYDHIVSLITGKVGVEKSTWAVGLIDKPDQDLYKTVAMLVDKKGLTSPNLSYERKEIEKATATQEKYLKEMLKNMKKDCSDMKKDMGKIASRLD